MVRPPIGYRFLPTSTELIYFFLQKKVNGMPLPHDAIKESDPFQNDPWELFDETSRDYFYVFTKMKVKDMQWIQKPVGSGVWVVLDCEETRDDNTGEIIGYDRQFRFWVTGNGAQNHGDWVLHQLSLPYDDYGDDEGAENYVICEFRNVDMDIDLDDDDSP